MTDVMCGYDQKFLRIMKFAYIYSPKKETQFVKKCNLLQIFNIILYTEISLTLY